MIARSIMPALLADRFFRLDSGVVVDLASGEEVMFRAYGAGSRREQQERAGRCAALYGCRHPHLVRLVDFGPDGPRHRFEAYGCAGRPARWERRDRATATALGGAVGFLHSLGLSAGVPAWSRVLEVGGRPLVLPDERTGTPIEGEPAPSRKAERDRWHRMLRASGVRSGCGSAGSGHVVGADCAAVDAIVESLDRMPLGRRSCVYLGAGPDGGVARAFALLAREARLRGFVPVSMRVIGGGRPLARAAGAIRDLLVERHAVLLDDRVSMGASESRAAAEGLSRMLVSLSEPAHSVLAVVAVPLGHGGMPRVDLEPHPRVAHCRRATGRATGTLGPDGERGAEAAPEGLCRGRTAGGQPSDSASQARACERGPAYTCTHGPQKTAGWLKPAPEGRAGRLLVEGRRLAESGRHASAERVLRAAGGALARRGDALGAGVAALELGRLVASRGRDQAACECFRAARDEFQRAEATQWAICSAIWIGLVKTEQKRFDEAETLLRAGLVAARNLPEANVVDFSRAGLARCLLWQGRLPEARAILRHEGPQGETLNPADDPLALWSEQNVRVAALEARAALAEGDLVSAGRAGQAALDSARRTGRASLRAVAHGALAAVHARLCDVDGLSLHVGHGLAAASQAHEPLRALRLRLILIRGLLGAGQTGLARAHGRRLASLHRTGLPPLLRDLVNEALSSLSGARAAAGRFRATCVHEPCAANLSGDRHRVGDARTGEGIDVDEIAEVLRLCHEIEDEREALARICALVRTRAGACAAGFFGVESHAAICLVTDGRLDAPVAQRAIDSSLCVMAARAGAGTEAAAPIRYAGSVTGAIACRWGVDAPSGADRAGPLLRAVAAACAPLVRVALDRRHAPAVEPGAGDFNLTGTSAAVAGIRHAIVRAARAPFAVLIEGESGSGKEVVARAIHREGPRRQRRFCPLNCAALSDELIEAELFGHARGAFTGAVTERTGLFEDASGGTIFLDEISELSPRAQAKLLRVIQEGEIRRIGENCARPIDARVIAATNRSLRGEAEAGRFRRDLLYRLDVIRIAMPPLRERIEDIPPLATRFWQQAAERIGSRAVLGQATLAALVRYDWPGNVRELQNVLASLAVEAPRRGVVGPGALPAAVARFSLQSDGQSLDEARRVFEQRFVRAALARSAGHLGRAAAELGMTRQGLGKLMTRLGVRRNAGGADREARR